MTDAPRRREGWNITRYKCAKKEMENGGEGEVSAMKKARCVHTSKGAHPSSIICQIRTSNGEKIQLSEKGGETSCFPPFRWISSDVHTCVNFFFFPPPLG
ncbi:conserved Plasmodium protein, unknown function [Plasmodium knowlesi strain H]|uniref:Uncharacterized protein n=3 Tax=Plasmodium knowlesi TaxID=5850 RepID=A0A5K1VBF0_PLAKH|nr:conserved Plasmodium protein, unknown function [Plasmodium knowlesi strain H]OTN68343.1 Uncharacterized protein PKNOH_S03317400 [Plasmodium knowlesi]CAA9987076.1 conserved Plasmodium protein, unknown function [Plasmodium knowlesi strain H]SBO23803.1 conserved Plasmodium protein, unknown function [Plasmodium knowlesi strain H]SBO25548.1 conserved Plasmodium protein, unknown function [Plasmodium knowlesi strain H]VVS76550.1 conserved Plasmodium protein, unknown function [Plasmodium knowlesi s|eukprot:XP_002261699.1 hypothetical protein, conserved in Plasmodium species [Plasmodium knowlesi strain H]